MWIQWGPRAELGLPVGLGITQRGFPTFVTGGDTLVPPPGPVLAQGTLGALGEVLGYTG